MSTTQIDDVQVREVRGPDVAPRLAELGPGLTPEFLEEVIKVGESARSRSSTRFHPCNGAGFSAYNERTYMLRMTLAKHSWTPEDPKGAPVIVHPNRHLQITVATGDEMTGTAAEPTTRYKKGPCMSWFIAGNQVPITFPGWVEDEPDDEVLALSPERSRRTYCLFVHRETESIIRAELSLPSRMVDGYPTKYLERIFLEPVDISGLDSTPPSNDDDDDIVVPITRK